MHSLQASISQKHIGGGRGGEKEEARKRATDGGFPLPILLICTQLYRQGKRHPLSVRAADWHVTVCRHGYMGTGCAPITHTNAHAHTHTHTHTHTLIPLTQGSTTCPSAEHIGLETLVRCNCHN